jgi:hypothetical protein
LFDADLARIAVMWIREVVSNSQHKVDIFHDWEEMELYTTEARTELTDLGVNVAARVNSLSVMIGSNLVKMGVTMASLKLTGIRMFTVREEFDQAVRQAVEARGATFTPAPPG